MARPALTEEQKREIRRNIRSAAAEIYAEQGSHNITARAVAQRAGVSVGTVYSHFNSLSELLQSLWRQPARKLVQQLQKIEAKHPDPVERLPKLLKAYQQFSEKNPSVFRNAFLFVRPEKQAAPEQIALNDDEFFCIYRRAITDGQEAGVYRSGDADELTQAVLSAVHGAIAMPVNLHRLALVPGKDMAAFVTDAMLDWLKK